MSEHKTFYFPQVAVDQGGDAYTLEFFGEGEMAAAVSGPRPKISGVLQIIPEVHREPASSQDDAWEKLVAWVKARGWQIR